MPRKTKKEKLLAAIHRKRAEVKIPLKYKPFSPTPYDQTKGELSKNSLQLPRLSIIMPAAREKALDNNYSYIFRDLIKISSFTLLAIVAQFMLVWFLRTR